MSRVNVNFQKTSSKVLVEELIGWKYKTAQNKGCSMLVEDRSKIRLNLKILSFGKAENASAPQHAIINVDFGDFV